MTLLFLIKPKTKKALYSFLGKKIGMIPHLMAESFKRILAGILQDQVLAKSLQKGILLVKLYMFKLSLYYFIIRGSFVLLPLVTVPYLERLFYALF